MPRFARGGWGYGWAPGSGYGPCRCGFGPHAYYPGRRFGYPAPFWGYEPTLEELKGFKAELESQLKEVDEILKGKE